MCPVSVCVDRDAAAPPGAKKIRRSPDGLDDGQRGAASIPRAGRAYPRGPSDGDTVQRVVKEDYASLMCG